MCPELKNKQTNKKPSAAKKEEREYLLAFQKDFEG
jgi:hypothetical protein